MVCKSFQGLRQAKDSKREHLPERILDHFFRFRNAEKGDPRGELLQLSHGFAGVSTSDQLGSEITESDFKEEFGSEASFCK